MTGAESDRPTLDPAALHGLAGRIVRALEPNTEADPAALLVDLLVSFGNAVGPGPHAEADGAEHPARLNALLIGDTSRARKGTARARIRAIFDHADPDWSSHRVVGGLASGEGLIASIRDGDDGAQLEDKRLLVVEPEFSRVLKAAGRDGNTLSAVIREAWDTGTLRVMTRRDPLEATSAHVSIIGHITEDELRLRLTETEIANGFANRFLLAWVHRSRLLPTGGSFDAEEIRRLGRLCRSALERARKVDVLPRTPPAEGLWAHLYELMANDPGGLVGALTARAEAQVLRLSVVYALMDEEPQRIEVDHLQAAWALWRYCEASAAHVFGQLTGDHIADRLVVALQTAGERGLDGTQQRDLFDRHVDGRKLQAARELLQTQGRAVTVEESTRGRPRRVTRAVSKNGTTKATEVTPSA